MLIGLALTVLMTGASSAPTGPVLTSLNRSLSDPAGGSTIVITGTDLDSATGVTWGGAAASITANTSTSCTITTPAKAEGSSYDIVLTTAAGVSNGLPLESWYPGTEATCTLVLQKPSYAIVESPPTVFTGTWTARKGSNFSYAIPPNVPTDASGAPDYSATGKLLVGPNLSTFTTATTGGYFVVANLDSVSAPVANVYDEPCFIGMSGNARIILTINSSGLRPGIYDGAYRDITAFGGDLSGATHAFAMRWDSTNPFEGRVDAGSWQAHASATSPDNVLTNATQLGSNYSGAATTDGRELAVCIFNAKQSDAIANKCVEWARAHLGAV